MPFQFKQLQFSSFTGGLTANFSITSAAGSLMVANFGFISTGGSTPTGMTVSDGTNNYQIPVAMVGPLNLGGGSNFWIGIAFLPSSPGGTQTITVTFLSNGGTSTSCSVGVMEFTYSPHGTILFDYASFVSNTNNVAAGSQPITVPTIAPSNPHSLLVANVQVNGTATSNSPWLNASGTSSDFYDLDSGTGPVAMNCTDSTTPDTWMISIAAFSVTETLFDDYSPEQQRLVGEKRRVTVFS